MMDLSSSMMRAGARQVSAALGEAATREGMGMALRLLQQSAAAAGAMLPSAVGIEWLELANKLEAFERFQQASAMPDPAETGAYPFLWTAEGLGYAWAAAGPPRWLRDSPPGLAAIPLHTGAALFFATRLLETDPYANGLEGWLTLWEENARPNHRDLAVEALGLVARNLYPYRVQGLGDWLRSAGPDLAELFWHGVGRGLYFAPTHALPWSGAAGRAFRKAAEEPPDEAGRRNATAGLSWALTLVNLRHPEVLADVLWRHGREIASTEAFANGVSSAVLIWYDAVGYDSHLANFLEYRSGSPRLWRDLVTAPCETALRHVYPRLQREGGLAALFRCPPSGRGVTD